MENVTKIMTKEIACNILRYLDFEADKAYLDGVSSPVFHRLWDISAFDKSCFSEHRSKVFAANPPDPHGIGARLSHILPSCSLAHALTAIASGRASVGLSSTGESVAELICADGSVQYAVYNPFSHYLKACVVPKGEENAVCYKLARSSCQGSIVSDGFRSTVLILALLPSLMEDREFSNGYDEIMSRLNASVHGDVSEKDTIKNSKILATISDNADMRLRYNVLENSICIESPDLTSKRCEFPLMKLADVKSGGHYFPVNIKIGKFSTLLDH